MDTKDGAVCVKPFNHLLHLLISVVGGCLMWIAAIAIVQSYPKATLTLVLLIALFVLLLAANCYWHYDSYLRQRGEDRELVAAMLMQAFVLSCWLAFSVQVVMPLVKLSGLPSVTIQTAGAPAR